mmetsp:Transcript_42428/g.99623  ORF Transcript_42428/g.99623 Transcript_42428/m.99623 type:complete len:404 (-) Transcript_42428:270-1481(-)
MSQKDEDKIPAVGTAEKQSQSVDKNLTDASASNSSKPSSESCEADLNLKRLREDYPNDDQSSVHDFNLSSVDSSSVSATTSQSKRMKRILSNREHARASYLRKKKMIEDLKSNVSKYEEENKRLREENNLLKANLANSAKYANTAPSNAPSRLAIPPPQHMSKYDEENKRLRDENNLLKANQLSAMQYANASSSVAGPHLGMPPPQQMSIFEEENMRLREENNLLKANQLSTLQYANTASAINASHLRMQPHQVASAGPSYMTAPAHAHQTMRLDSLPNGSASMTEQRQCLRDTPSALQQSSMGSLPTSSVVHNVPGGIPGSSSVLAADSVSASDYHRMMGESIRFGAGDRMLQEYMSHRLTFDLLNSNSGRDSNQNQISQEKLLGQLNVTSGDAKLRRVSDH